MSDIVSEVIKNRYEFSLLFDVENGNPNGDPDAGNMPRMEQETNYGFVTDVCLKRKIRNYMDAVYGKVEGYRTYIKEGIPLADSNKEALAYYGIDDNFRTLTKDDNDIEVKLRDFMCKNFFDIRAFGTVMTTYTGLKLNCGQIRGPIQLAFAKSVELIMPQEITITRLVGATDKEHTIGKKYIIPYALYRVDGFISANLAQTVTKFNEDDLERFWEALTNMFELDRSASRGKMAVRKLVVFKHDSQFGNAPAHQLFDLIKIKNNGENGVARSYQDYEIIIDKDARPAGVSCIEKV